MKRARKHDEDNGFGEWGGYMEAKISKLEEQFIQVTTKQADQVSNIFKGISIFVNGYTKPSATELKMIMAEHGGIFHHYHRPGKTTYIIASNLPDVKARSITSCKIISPQWITDSIAAQKLLDYSKYLLYTNQSKSQPKIAFVSNIEQKTEDKLKKKTCLDLEISPDLFESSGSLGSDNEMFPPNQLKNEIPESTMDNIIDDITVNDKKKLNEQIPITNTHTLVKETKKSSIKTAVDPGFLAEFYNNSRLHHIATLGAGFKQYITELRTKSNNHFPGIGELIALPKTDIRTGSTDTRIIMHIDMDCFFVSVGLRNKPHLQGIPVAVTHSKGGTKNHVRPGSDIKREIEMYKQRNQLNSNDGKLEELSEVERRLCNIGEFDSLSEIASCSYEARKAGVTNGMFMGAALKLCPNLKAIPYDFDGYKEVAYTLYDTIARYTLNIEAVSCDEMFVDCTDLLEKTSISVNDFASYVRSEIKQKTFCPCSTGFGSNKLLARLATKKAKPDGQFFLEDINVEEYMNEILISDLPGVGHSTMNRLKSLGCTTCGDLKNLSITMLQKEFGNKNGESLYKNCRGIDERPLVYEQIRKSVSAEVNYGIRFKTSEEYETFLKQLSNEVHSRLKEIGKKGRCITLKLMVRAQEAPKETAKYMGHGFCDNISKCQTLHSATDSIEIITKAVLNISNTMDVKPDDLRGIGIQISRLENLKNSDNAKSSLTALFKKVSENVKNVETNNTVIMSTKTCKTDYKHTEKDIQKLKNPIQMFTKPIKDIESDVNNDINSVLRNGNSLDVNNERNKFSDKSITKKSPVKKENVRKGKKLVKNKSNNTLEKFFGQRKNITKSLEPDDMRLLGIDPEVLASLPDDIKAEVMRDCRLKAEKLNKPGPSKEFNNTKPIIEIDMEFLNAMPEDIRREIEDELMTTNMLKDKMEESSYNNQNESERIYLDKPKSNNVCGIEYSTIFGDITKTRSLIRNWITKEISPKFCDIEMLMKYLMEQVEDDIQNVYYIIKFLYRIISEQISHDGICHWHKAYSQIIAGVQEAMLNFYGNKLFVENYFKCDMCCDI